MSEIRPPPVLPKYTLLERLGRGGWGEVWKARDEQVDRIVAVKFLHTTDDEHLARFRREAHAVGQLAHPHIAQLFEFSASGSIPYIAMQYVEGVPLHQFEPSFSSMRPAPVSHGSSSAARGSAAAHRILLARIGALRDAAGAVQYAHDRGIVHRDLKPANILVTADGHALVLDFGLAREMRADTSALTESGDVLGTPSYMAPEQALGKMDAIGPRTDVYGLGATLYTLLAGHPPHTGPTSYEVIRKVIDEEPPRPGGDRDLETICLKAIEKDSARRYATVADFAADLERFLAGEAIQARPPSLPYRLRKKIQRQPLVWGLGLLLLIVGAAGGATAITLLALSREHLADLLETRARAAEAERERLAELQSRERARPHLDAGRRLLLRLELLLRSPEPDPAEVPTSREAIARFDAALAAAPRLAEAFLERGRVHLLMGRDLSAREDFTRAAEASPQFATALLERALVDLVRYDGLRHDRGGTVRAESPVAARIRESIEADLDAVGRWSRDVGELAYADGLLAFARGDFAGAAERVREYVGTNPTDGVAWHWLGHALYHEARYEEARDAFTESLLQRPRSVEALGLRGATRRMLGDPAGAVQDHDAALALMPDDAVSYFNRGNANWDLGDAGRAERDYTQAIEIDDRYPDAFDRRGQLRMALGRAAEAAEDFRSALRVAAADWPPRDAVTERLRQAEREGDF